MESNKSFERGAGERALLFPRSDSRRRRPRWFGSGGIEQLVEEGDRSATVRDVEGAAVEMIAQGVEVDLGQWAEVGAFGIAATNQPVELFDTAFVARPIGPGEEDRLRPTQRFGHGGVPGELAAIIERERAKGGSEGTQQSDEGRADRVAAFVEQAIDQAQTAFALPQHQQEALGIESLDQVTLPVTELAALVRFSRTFGDISAMGNGAVAPTAAPTPRSAAARQMAIERATPAAISVDQAVTGPLAHTDPQQRNLPGGEAFFEQPNQALQRFRGLRLRPSPRSPFLGEPLGRSVVVGRSHRAAVAPQLPTHRRGRTPNRSGHRSLTASGLNHDLDSMAFCRRQLPVVSIKHTRSSGLAGAKLQAAGAVFRPLAHVLHFTWQDASLFE